MKTKMRILSGLMALTTMGTIAISTSAHGGGDKEGGNLKFSLEFNSAPQKESKVSKLKKFCKFLSKAGLAYLLMDYGIRHSNKDSFIDCSKILLNLAKEFGISVYALLKNQGVFVGIAAAGTVIASQSISEIYKSLVKAYKRK